MFYYLISGKFHSNELFDAYFKTRTTMSVDELLEFSAEHGLDFATVNSFKNVTPISKKKFDEATDKRADRIEEYVCWINLADGGLYEPKKPENKKSPFVCPICGANIKYERIDDGTTTLIIDKAGEFKDVFVDSKGSTRVYCSVDETHEISDSKQDLIIRLVKKEGY